MPCRHLHGDPVDGWLNFPVLEVADHCPDFFQAERCRSSAHRYHSSNLSADCHCCLFLLFPVIAPDSDRSSDRRSAWALRYSHQSSAVLTPDRHLDFVV